MRNVFIVAVTAASLFTLLSGDAEAKGNENKVTTKTVTKAGAGLSTTSVNMAQNNVSTRQAKRYTKQNLDEKWAKGDAKTYNTIRAGSTAQVQTTTKVKKRVK